MTPKYSMIQRHRACWVTARLCLAMSVCLATLCLPGAIFGHGGIDERIAELNADLKDTPNDAMLHYMLADAHAQHQDWFATSKALERVEQLAPGKFATDLVRARLNLGLGRAAEARVFLDRFLKATPSHRLALVLRAQAFAKLGDDEACVTDYRSALDVPGDGDPDLLLEVADALFTRGYQDEAASVLVAGIRKLGSVPSLELRVMEMEIANGRFDAALSRIEAVQLSAPRPEPWMAKRAEILQQAGRPAEASAAWRKLADHLAALPPLERGSHAMSLLAEQTHRALGRATPKPVVAPPAPKFSNVSPAKP